MSSILTYYIPSEGTATLETTLGNELKALDSLFAGTVPFETTDSDRETIFVTVDILETNTHLKFTTGDLNKIRKEVQDHLAYRGIDQVDAGENVEYPVPEAPKPQEAPKSIHEPYRVNPETPEITPEETTPTTDGDVQTPAVQEDPTTPEAPAVTGDDDTVEEKLHWKTIEKMEKEIADGTLDFDSLSNSEKKQILESREKNAK